MSVYVVPQVLVFQEIDLVPATVVRPLNAHIAGGHAHLIRYSEADEKPFGALGAYERLADTDYGWPNRPAGGVVDQSYTKVTIENALLRYFSHNIGTGDEVLTTVDGANLLVSDTYWKSNGTTYPRDALLINRDVKTGDAVKLRALVGSDAYELCTYVAGFKADVVAAIVAAAVSDDDNNENSSLALTDDGQVSGAINHVVIDATDISTYDGRIDGDIEETYTVTVTAASAGGDATTGRLRITSASGRDDVASVTPAAFGSPTDIGTRGFTVTFENDGTDPPDDGVDEDDFVVGQTWAFTVTQAHTASKATSSGTYSGTVDDTYVVTVLRGGRFNQDAPLIKVRTVHGLDISGPTEVVTSGVAVACGTKGTLIAFNQTALVTGDRYYIDVTAATDGAYRTLVLGHNLPPEVVAEGGSVSVDLDLYIRKTVEVNPYRVEAAPELNYEQSATQLTLKAGITAFDDSWTDEDGDPAALPIFSACNYGNVFVTARYWLATLCGEVNAIANTSELDAAISGPLHPDNPLKWGVFSAVQNSNGRNVTYSAICNPDEVDEWANMLERIDGRRDTYGLVPLTRNKTVWSLYQGHVSGQSSPEFGRWRAAWLNSEGIPEKAIVTSATSTNGNTVLATIADDPLTSGTQYTLLQVPANNGQFVTNDVQPGDIVRFLFTDDGFGNASYTEYVVDAVLNEDSIRLLVGSDVPVSVAEKMEIYRNLSATEQAAELALTWGFSDRRVRMVWPDELTQDGYTVPGYFLCAALAGLRSGVVPQQGLTHLEIAGFSAVPRTTRTFNRTQLNTMAGGGMFIVTQDLETGSIFARHAVTTADNADIAAREEMVVSNLDSISFFFLDLYDPYIGVSNVTPSALDVLRAETNAGIKYLESSFFVARLGPQLISGTLTELRAHTILKDRVVVAIDLVLPFPMNNIEVHLKLVA